MNVLFVAEYYFANPDFVRLSRELAKRGHGMHVATSLRVWDKKALDTVSIFEIKPMVSIHKIPHTLSFPLSKLNQIVRKQGINVIHVLNDGSTNAAAASLVAKATKKSLVYTIQGPGTRTGHFLVDSITSIYILTVESWIAREAQKILLLSRSLTSLSDRMGIERSKTVVIPSGIDTEYFSPESSDTKEKASRLRDELDLNDEITIGYVGRLFPAKGLTYLFSAMKQIQDSHPNVALLIVGDGAQRSELETIAKTMKIRTIFAGWQHDVLPYYALMDVFVLPSLFEGLPNVILEAMAMKTAVVATNVGGNPDVLTHGENGFLVPTRDASKLAWALEKLVEDDDLRIKMAENNRRKVEEHFKWSKTVEKVEKVYRELI